MQLPFHPTTQVVIYKAATNHANDVQMNSQNE